MIIQYKVKKIIERLAKKYNLPEEEVRRIVFTPFALVKKTMKSAEKDTENSFKNIRIINLGLFAVKPGRLKSLMKSKKDKDDGERE